MRGENPKGTHRSGNPTPSIEHFHEGNIGLRRSPATHCASSSRRMRSWYSQKRSVELISRQVRFEAGRLFAGSQRPALYGPGLDFFSVVISTATVTFRGGPRPLFQALRNLTIMDASLVPMPLLRDTECRFRQSRYVAVKKALPSLVRLKVKTTLGAGFLTALITRPRLDWMSKSKWERARFAAPGDSARWIVVNISAGSISTCRPITSLPAAYALGGRSARSRSVETAPNVD
ncbi:unnamed protein product, partial [Iphiclides podalirius]